MPSKKTKPAPATPKKTAAPLSVDDYLSQQTGPLGEICRVLHAAIVAALPKSPAKVWHALPVWFVGENPVVGYKNSGKHVLLLFWNGQAFADPALTAAGQFRAAQIKYTDLAQIDPKQLTKWLKQAKTKVWDYRAQRDV